MCFPSVNPSSIPGIFWGFLQGSWMHAYFVLNPKILLKLLLWKWILYITIEQNIYFCTKPDFWLFSWGKWQSWEYGLGDEGWVWFQRVGLMFWKNVLECRLALVFTGQSQLMSTEELLRQGPIGYFSTISPVSTLCSNPNGPTQLLSNSLTLILLLTVHDPCPQPFYNLLNWPLTGLPNSNLYPPSNESSKLE